MNHLNKEQAQIVKNFIDAIEGDVDNEINFLVEALEFDEEEINEMGCLEITSLVIDELESMEYKDFIEASDIVNLDNFDHSSVYLEDSNTLVAEEAPKQPCKNPCPTCPYTKNSIPGYFGGHDANIYANAIHQDTVIACHSRTKHDEETGLPKSDKDIQICTGHIVSQIKSCKSTMHTDGIKAHAFVRSLDNFEELKENALAFDFKEHHNI